MAYYREIRLDELVQWLTEIRFSELTLEELSQKLFDRFDILTTSNSPT